MIYLWHIFVKWSLVYPTSALVCDIIVACAFVVFVFYFFSGLKEAERKFDEWCKRRKQNENNSTDRKQ